MRFQFGTSSNWSQFVTGWGLRSQTATLRATVGDYLHVKTMSVEVSLVPAERIKRAILLIRGERVILDSDLARLYEVETRVLNQAVKRNAARFPTDFMFQLTSEEATAVLNSRSQIVILKRGENIKYRPYAFTEQGVAMLSSVLHSNRAVQVNIGIMRAFVRLRQMLASNAELARKLESLEKKYDAQFKVVFDAIRQLMSLPEAKRNEIAFHVKHDDDKPKARKRQCLLRTIQH